jgi:hypothetical protein
METQSRCPAHFSVHHGGQHLALNPTERRRLAQVEILVQRSHKRRYKKVDAEDLKDSRDDSPVSATSPSEEESAESSDPGGVECQDACHCVPIFSVRKAFMKELARVEAVEDESGFEVPPET